MKMRIIYIGCSVFLIFIFYKYYQIVVSNSENNAIFSYFGSVATFIALLITICEVLISVHRSKSIQKETLKILNEYKKIDGASLFSDCLAAIDSVSKNILEEKFESALINFQYFRKICVRVIPGMNLENNFNRKFSKLSDIEYSLLKFTKSNQNSPVDKMQKNNMLTELLILKQHIENLNPAKRN